MSKTPASPRAARPVKLETTLTAPFEVAGFNPTYNDERTQFVIELATPECHIRFDQIVVNLRNSGQAVDLKYDLKDNDIGMSATIKLPEFPETGPTDQNSAKEFAKFTEAKVAPLSWTQAVKLAGKNDEGLAYLLYKTVANKVAGQSTNTAFLNACEDENYYADDPRSVAKRQQAARLLRTLGMSVTNWRSLEESAGNYFVIDADSREVVFGPAGEKDCQDWVNTNPDLAQGTNITTGHEEDGFLVVEAKTRSDLEKEIAELQAQYDKAAKFGKFVDMRKLQALSETRVLSYLDKDQGTWGTDEGKAGQWALAVAEELASKMGGKAVKGRAGYAVVKEATRSKGSDVMRVAVNDSHLAGLELDPAETAAHFGAETAYHLVTVAPLMARRRALDGEFYDLVKTAEGNYLVQPVGADKSEAAFAQTEDGARVEDYDEWRNAVRATYPEVADKLKFKGRVEGGTNTISAEVSGEDRSYGVYYPEDEYGVVFGTNENVQKEGVGDPEEGWCVVSSDRPRIVIDGPYLSRDDALAYKQSVPPAQSSGWLVLWGKEANDGSGEYVQTRAVNPTEAVNAFTGAVAYKNRKGLTESFQINQDTRTPVYRKHLRTGNVSQLIGDSETSVELESGVYHVYKDYDGNTFFERKAIRSDELLRFEDGRREHVLSEIREFWSLRENFADLGLGHKRGVLMYGPPGGGKSCIIKQVVEDAVNSNNVVLYPKSLDGLATIIREFRDVEPDRPILCVLEDVDGLIQYSEHALLELFDGDDQANHVLFLATTNYPERLPARVMRSGRFDTKIEIKQIPREGRIAYLQNKVGTRATVEEIENFADLTEDFSFAQMREFVASTFALKQNPKDAITRIRRNFTESRTSLKEAEDIEIWVVTTPNANSTLDDILFKSSVRKMERQYLGGLQAVEIAEIFLIDQETEARAFATKLLKTQPKKESEEDDEFESHLRNILPELPTVHGLTWNVGHYGYSTTTSLNLNLEDGFGNEVNSGVVEELASELGVSSSELRRDVEQCLQNAVKQLADAGVRSELDDASWTIVPLN